VAWARWHASTLAIAWHCCQLPAWLDNLRAHARGASLPGAQHGRQKPDLKGLACPLPISKTRKALFWLAKRATLEVFATDPGLGAGFSAFCETTGNRLLEKEEADGVYRFVIEHVG
jgi:tRNA 2-thiouridine synthesizing protein A